MEEKRAKEENNESDILIEEKDKDECEKTEAKEESKSEEIIKSSIAIESSKDIYSYYADSIYVRELSKREKILWLNASSFLLSFAISIPTLPFLGLYGAIVLLALICFFTIFEFFDDDISDIVIAKIIIWSRIDMEGVTKLQKNRTKALFFMFGKKWYP